MLHDTWTGEVENIPDIYESVHKKLARVKSTANQVASSTVLLRLDGPCHNICAQDKQISEGDQVLILSGANPSKLHSRLQGPGLFLTTVSTNNINWERVHPCWSWAINSACFHRTLPPRVLSIRWSRSIRLGSSATYVLLMDVQVWGRKFIRDFGEPKRFRFVMNQKSTLVHDTVWHHSATLSWHSATIVSVSPGVSVADVWGGAKCFFPASISEMRYVTHK